MKPKWKDFSHQEIKEYQTIVLLNEFITGDVYRIFGNSKLSNTIHFGTDAPSTINGGNPGETETSSDSM